MKLSNKDHEQEAAKEKEKFEKRIGLLNYLVDKSSTCVGDTCIYDC